MIKTGCVVQGNVRTELEHILSELMRHFDQVILSTWSEDALKIPKGKFEVILNQKPENPGFTNRNYQRVSTAAGLKCAEELGCTHVLKWRTDMLPTKLDVDKLLEWSDFQVPKGVSSRIVTCAFRNLSVIPDYFSSIPDLFAFADIEMMKLLWGTENFDFNKSFNAPQEMYDDCGFEWVSDPNISGLFCAESELYATFKARLERKLHSKLNHIEIASKYMYLINHDRLGICWFGPNGGFRSITQALQFPWWTERTWKTCKPKIIEMGYPETYLWQKLKRRLTPWVIKENIQMQKKWIDKFNRNKKVGSHD